ncbi:ABC transporter ATP-binding protein [Treponema pedis]|uniref:ABC transporter ATP-binding protein n=2 Tax=Treponema pedis TaxID=409322 RepID=S5ZXU0_9SPIR|nr:ABC transporter ATP-binding protein [Treponema pedis]AGT42783.1 ABC transporter ATP-binding protein [Treponema pedis str. T A4]
MKNERKYGLLSIVLRNSYEYFKKATGWGALEQAIAVSRALSWTAGIMAMQKLFDAIAIASRGTHSFVQIAFYLVLLALITVSRQVLSGTGQYLFSKVSYTNMGKFMTEFQYKLSRLPAKKFEDIIFLNDINKAKECLEYESLGHFASVCLQLFSYYSVFFISAGGYLFRLSPILPTVILAAFIPAVIGQLMQIKFFEELEEINAPLRRQCEYYRKTVADRAFYKETRILGGFNFFYRLFIDSLQTLTAAVWKTERKAAVLHFALSLISFAGLGAAVLILFYAVMAGNISIGAFASVFVALSQIFSIVNEIVSGHLSKGSEILGQVRNFYRLMDMEEVDGEEGSIDFTKGIVASNVSFTYPGFNKPAVHDINLTIKREETIAVVGENGSGKSTLVRLLTGLYIPDSGTVEIGGKNTKTSRPNTIFKGISAVFQHYQCYKMTLEENVSVSDTENPPDKGKIQSCLRESEFNEDTVTLDKMLSPEFGGIDLSGGQWQRLAIARGLYRIHDFIVLDEPTAAIDPIEEARLYEQFGRLVKNKCALIVTHRLGSVKHADRIVVMNGGKIEDIGTHEELILRNGTYADMWKAQSVWYERGFIYTKGLSSIYFK